MICITCPKGCRLTINEEAGLSVTGHACHRGEEYAKNEILNPVRMITSTVRIVGSVHRRCPVKTDAAIPKGKIFEAMESLNDVELSSPVKCGQIIVESVCGTKVNFISTRDI